MLPRFKKLDREFKDAVESYVRARSRSDGILSQIGSHLIHEGRSNTIQRSPTDAETTKMTETSAEVTIGFDEIEKADFSFIVGKATEIAEQFGSKMSGHLFQTMDEVTKQTGLRHDGGGKPLTNEAIMQIIEAMHVDFDEEGNPTFSIVAPPSMMSTFQKLDAEMKRDATLRKRWDDLMGKKRDEFRTREINRNLA